MLSAFFVCYDDCMAIINVRLLVKTFVTNNKGEILLLQRSATDDRRPLGWDLPGGNVDYNEDPNVAALRELKEGAGLDLPNLEAFYVASETEDHYIVTLFYKGMADSNDVTLSFEHEQYTWIRPEEITAFDMSEKYVISAKMLSQSADSTGRA
jgi:8-oxo-dGTP diphosphatase